MSAPSSSSASDSRSASLAFVEASDLVVAFWDGSSAGTKHALDYARTRGTPVQVVRFDAPAP